jgi:hypothetical protein
LQDDYDIEEERREKGEELNEIQHHSLSAITG